MKHVIFGTGCIKGQNGHIFAGIMQVEIFSSARYLFGKLRQEAAGTLSTDNLTPGLLQPLNYPLTEESTEQVLQELRHIVELQPLLIKNTTLRAIVFNKNPRILADYVEDDELLAQFEGILGIEARSVSRLSQPIIRLRV